MGIAIASATKTDSAKLNGRRDMSDSSSNRNFRRASRLDGAAFARKAEIRMQRTKLFEPSIHAPAKCSNRFDFRRLSGIRGEFGDVPISVWRQCGIPYG